MKKELNIGLLLDVCGISYTEDQLIKLEKLIEDLLHDHRPNNVDISKIENHEKDDLLDALDHPQSFPSSLYIQLTAAPVF